MSNKTVSVPSRGIQVYILFWGLIMVGFIISFRPLSRYIGLYHGGVLPNTGEKEGFPSPLEVYRFISGMETKLYEFILSFRPLSRYIGLYQEFEEQVNELLKIVSVPSRGIQVYIAKSSEVKFIVMCFRPLSRYIGLYRNITFNRLICTVVSVPSRGIQVYINGYVQHQLQR